MISLMENDKGFTDPVNMVNLGECFIVKLVEMILEMIPKVRAAVQQVLVL